MRPTSARAGPGAGNHLFTDLAQPHVYLDAVPAAGLRRPAFAGMERAAFAAAPASQRGVVHHPGLGARWLAPLLPRPRPGASWITGHCAADAGAGRLGCCDRGLTPALGAGPHLHQCPLAAHEERKTAFPGLSTSFHATGNHMKNPTPGLFSPFTRTPPPRNPHLATTTASPEGRVLSLQQPAANFVGHHPGVGIVHLLRLSRGLYQRRGGNFGHRLCCSRLSAGTNAASWPTPQR